MMGSTGVNANEMPMHEVCLDAFWISKTEVTNAQYKMCVDAGRCELPFDTIYEEFCNYNDPVYVDHPVVCIDWYLAQAFAKWLGGNLPTEAQWEYVARGSAGYKYSWGNEKLTCDLANYSGCVGRTMPVGSYRDGVSWVGALEMNGNVWEWVHSEYRDYPYNADDGRENNNSNNYRVVRGGSFRSSAFSIRAAYRRDWHLRNSDDDLGFRVVIPVSTK